MTSTSASPAFRPAFLAGGLPKPGTWTLVALLIAGVFALPVLVVAGFALAPAGESWAHLAETVLWRYVSNTLLLTAGVATGTLIIGVGTAWLVTMTRFPGRRAFEWALFLPLAFPAYILAYTYTGMLDYAGPVQTALRETFGWSRGDYWFPGIRSLGGAVSLLSLVLYPYVYMLARTAFLEQSVCVIELSRTLGCTAWQSFRRVALPLARPAIAAGVALALMETLGDFGTVQYFAVDTFTTGIFRTWLGLGDVTAAGQMAAVLLVFVFAALMLERWSRGQARFHHTTGRYRPLPGYRLTGAQRWLASAVCFVPVFLGFLLPGSQLLAWFVEIGPGGLNARFFGLLGNSVGVAAAAAVLAVLLGLVLAYAARLSGGAVARTATRIASLGYAIPGPVVAVGVIVPFAWLDNSIDAWMRAQFGLSTGLILSGTLAALVFAYLVRFLAVSLNTIDSSLAKVTPAMDDAARALGSSALGTLARVHIPILRAGLLTAAMLVFVDVLKELPATLILRPFNFDTLAVRAFELASDEQLAATSLPALAIVCAGLIPVVVLSRAIGRSRPGQAAGEWRP